MTKLDNTYWQKYYDHILQVIPWEGTYTYRKAEDRFYFLRGFASLLYNTLKVITRYGLKRTPLLEKHKPFLFYYETLNQYNSLLPLMEHYMERSSRLMHPQLSPTFKGDVISLGKIYLLSILAYPIAFWRSRKLVIAYHAKMSKSHVVVNAALAQAAWWMSYRLLKKCKPSLILVSNDHLFIPVSLLFAARLFNIKTIYLQHASVSAVFPPLYVDYALLDGRKAEQVYSVKPTPSFVHKVLVGMLKADGYVRWRKAGTHIRSVGICINSVDRVEAIRHLIDYIHHHHSDLQISLRLHPAMQLPHNFFNGVQSISSPKNETMFEYLKSVDILIAGESSVHVEAAIMNIPSFYYNTRSVLIDDYGFVEDKLVETYFEKPELFTQALLALDITRNFTSKAKPYCHTIETEHENHSAQHAIKYINNLIG
jgi:hypothetical protein